MKNVLITGISKGLGLEITRIFLKNGWHVWGISRKITDELNNLISNNPNKIHWKSFDLEEPENIHNDVFKEFIDFSIPLHAVINNAAIAYDDIITNLHQQPLEKMFKVNVYSSMMIVKYAIRNMLYHQIKGSIVHISSISVHTGYKGLSMYASTKGAIEAFSKNIAREWGERRIRSNCVVAGFMETEMSSLLSVEQKDRIYNRTALKRATEPKSVAETVFYLVSDKAKSITGQNLHVDSGTI